MLAALANHRFGGLSSELDTLWNSDRVWHSDAFRNPFRRTGTLKYAAMDIIDNGKKITIHIDLPGISSGNAHLTLTGRTLHIDVDPAVAHDQNATYYVNERTYGTFSRTVDLPQNADPEGLTATYADGVLTIETNVLTGNRSRVIPIRTI